MIFLPPEFTLSNLLDTNRHRYPLLAVIAASLLVHAIFWQPVFAAEEEKEKKSSLSQYWTEDSEHFNLACENGSVFEKSGKDTLLLKSGTFLIESEKEMNLQMAKSTVQLKPKSILLVRVSPDTERFYCLLQSAALQVGTHALTIQVGEEVFLADHNPKPAELTGEFDVGVRQLKGFDLAADRKLATMEFSILQAMEREPLLVQISHSRHSHDSSLRAKLMKAAAVLNVVTNRHGPYAGF